VSPPGQPNVLVVDDMQNTRMLVRLLLEKQFKAQVTEAPDGLAALTIAIKDPPDLIISDVAMPRMNGLEFVKSIRDMPELADVPIILLTSKSEQVYKTRAAMLKVQDYLVKPFTPASFTELLGQYLST
jgi:CheY-like chemotaxis protein